MGNNKFSIASVGNRRAFRDGARDGVPIALGYFAVSFSLGIVARNVGMTPIQGMITSALCNASAGECRFSTGFSWPLILPMSCLELRSQDRAA